MPLQPLLLHWLLQPAVAGVAAAVEAQGQMRQAASHE
jgi:hypothetical protein